MKSIKYICTVIMFITLSLAMNDIIQAYEATVKLLPIEEILKITKSIRINLVVAFLAMMAVELIKILEEKK